MKKDWIEMFDVIARCVDEADPAAAGGDYLSITGGTLADLRKIKKLL